MRRITHPRPLLAGRENGGKARRWALLLLSLVLFLGTRAWGQTVTAPQPSPTTQIHWQARMNDTLTVSVRMNYDARLKAGERARLADATVVRRGQVRRERVVLRHVECLEESGAVLELSFTCDFEHHGVRYRLRGRYTDDPENNGSGRQSIQCVPLTLGRDIMEQGGYQPRKN